MWWFYVVSALAGLWVLGRVVALVRGTPAPEDIRYHWNHWLGTLAYRTSPKPHRADANWKMTFGRHTFVQRAEILGESRAHEYWHSVDMYHRSIPVAVAHYVYQYIRYGYREAPVEIEARAFADKHKAEFADVRRLG